MRAFLLAMLAMMFAFAAANSVADDLAGQRVSRAIRNEGEGAHAGQAAQDRGEEPDARNE